MKLVALFLGVAVLAVVAACVTVALGPGNLRAQFTREAAALESGAAPAEPVTESDLARVPAPVARWLRTCGVVGRPRPRTFRVRFHGALRGGPQEPWMPVEVEQVSRVRPAARLFYLQARMNGLPVYGLHRYLDGAADMRIRLLGALPVVNASGPVMKRSETVTMFDDLALLAPAALLDSAIAWGETRGDTVYATYAAAGNVVRAGLVFGPDGALADFVSDDRSRASRDGRSFTRERWSTPVTATRAYGPYRLFARGEARWHPAGGEYAYARLDVSDIAYDTAAR
jgi:hypothetical protein